MSVRALSAASADLSAIDPTAGDAAITATALALDIPAPFLRAGLEVTDLTATTWDSVQNLRWALAVQGMAREVAGPLYRLSWPTSFDRDLRFRYPTELGFYVQVDPHDVAEMTDETRPTTKVQKWTRRDFESFVGGPQGGGGEMAHVVTVDEELDLCKDCSPRDSCCWGAW